MGLVIASASMSLDGYIAWNDNTIGRLFDWLQNGAVEIPTVNGDITLHLSPPSAEYRKHDPNTGPVHPGGLNHLVIQVDDLHATVARLAAHGLQADATSSPNGSEGFWTTWLTDPDGYRIELVQWPTGHADGLTRADFPGQGPPSATAFDGSPS